MFNTSFKKKKNQDYISFCPRLTKAMLLVLVRMPVSHPLMMVGGPWERAEPGVMGAVQDHWGRECEPGPRSPEANFRLGKRRSGCRAGTLLVWAAAYLGLEETAGDTVNRGRAASLG